MGTKAASKSSKLFEKFSKQIFRNSLNYMFAFYVFTDRQFFYNKKLSGISKRKEDYMWTSAFILAHFMRFAENTLITRRDLLNYGTQDAIDSALRRMIRKEESLFG